MDDTMRARKVITIALLVASIVMIVVGVMAGEPNTVLGKAINVCMECMGIG